MQEERTSAGTRLTDVDETELEIEQLVSGGDGLGRFEGIPIFVPRSAPGDRLRVRLTERRPGYGRAEIVEIITPGPGRREPPCPYFTRCGGCDLQHLEDDVQLRLKAEAVRETLRRLGGIEMPSKVVVEAGEPWHYRLRCQLHAAETDRGIEVGYYERGSRDLVPVESCPILVPELERLLPELPQALRDETHRRVDLAAGSDGRWTAAPAIEGLPQGDVTFEAAGFTYAYDARCFFQGHRGLLEKLVEHAVGSWEGEEAFDLYAGVGLFALPLARRYEKVTAVEGDRVAARFARNNARRNKAKNVLAEAQAIETWISNLPEGAERVVVDPPRAGLATRVRALLRQRKARRLSYVSCHAATLARDLKYLDPIYELESLALLDLFPQTGHIEVVAQLVRRDSGDSEGASA